MCYTIDIFSSSLYPLHSALSPSNKPIEYLNKSIIPTHLSTTLPPSATIIPELPEKHQTFLLTLTNLLFPSLPHSSSHVHSPTPTHGISTTATTPSSDDQWDRGTAATEHTPSQADVRRVSAGVSTHWQRVLLYLQTEGDVDGGAFQLHGQRQ